ncbi:hypothetical protein FB45DRAFT_919955 [Roridomyces roridus]|uniref:Uncharacterized protein n=1 Tax=Roridomyces roridus TaxID=1738132 RepID=A0AAD7BS65_9AGAR|nr:hypothetical protein FB45DRAFT_919955 [Roridomyces roridus]
MPFTKIFDLFDLGFIARPVLALFSSQRLRRLLTRSFLLTHHTHTPFTTTTPFQRRSLSTFLESVPGLAVAVMPHAANGAMHPRMHLHDRSGALAVRQRGGFTTTIFATVITTFGGGGENPGHRTPNNDPPTVTQEQPPPATPNTSTTPTPPTTTPPTPTPTSPSSSTTRPSVTSSSPSNTPPAPIVSSVAHSSLPITHIASSLTTIALIGVSPTHSSSPSSLPSASALPDSSDTSSSPSSSLPGLLSAPSASSSPPPASSSSNTPKHAAVAAGIIIPIFLLLLLASILMWFRRRRRQREAQWETDAEVAKEAAAWKPPMVSVSVAAAASATDRSRHMSSRTSTASESHAYSHSAVSHPYSSGWQTKTISPFNARSAYVPGLSEDEGDSEGEDEGEGEGEVEGEGMDLGAQQIPIAGVSAWSARVPAFDGLGFDTSMFSMPFHAAGSTSPTASVSHEQEDGLGEDGSTIQDVDFEPSESDEKTAAADPDPKWASEPPPTPHTPATPATPATFRTGTGTPALSRAPTFRTVASAPPGYARPLPELPVPLIHVEFGR